MYSIPGSLPRPGVGYLSNSILNCFRPLDISSQVGDATQAITSMPLRSGVGLDKALDASDMSAISELEDESNEFETTHDDFETKATIGGLYFILIYE